MNCLICLNSDPDTGSYHAACLEGLFGTRTLPHIDFDQTAAPRRTAESSGTRFSISGIQPKMTARLTEDRTSLEVVRLREAQFLIKTQLSGYHHVPENEHLGMVLARLCGLRVPDCGIFQLQDESLAYLVRLFDRKTENPRQRYRVIDFCALAGLPSAQKDRGTAELCADLVRSKAADPDVEVRQLFRLFLFAYWISDGDLHLKNISLLEGEDGQYHLAPVYDLVSTGFHLKEDVMAMKVAGRTRNLTWRQWTDFAAHCQIPRDEALRIVDEMVSRTQDAAGFIQRSALPDPHRRQYEDLLRKRSRALSSPRPSSNSP